MAQPDLNVSVRWKIIGAFVLTAGWPLLAVQLTLPPWLILISTVLLALGLGYYSAQRILSMVERVGAHLGHPLDDTRCELAALEQAVETLAAAATVMPRGERRSEYKAELATGTSVHATAVMMPEPDPEVLLMRAKITGDEARQRLRQAIEEVVGELRELMRGSQVGEIEVLEFQLLMLEDGAFVGLIKDSISAGLPLVESIERACAQLRGRFNLMETTYMQARALDCDDLRKRLVNAVLGGMDVDELREQVSGRIVLCQQILPSEVVALSHCGVKGTAASHSEILLDAFGIPALSRLHNIDLHTIAGQPVLLDIPARTLVLHPDPARWALAETDSQTPPPDPEPALLRSGERIHIGATINNVNIEAGVARQAGADDVGLFRTEIDFIASPHLPTESELTARYCELIRVFEGCPVTMRMLDLGSDKLAHFQQEVREENPCMGNRSMRLLLSEPSLFRTQFRAMLRAATDGTAIIFPMISGWYELEQIQRHIANFVTEYEESGNTVPKLKYGLMLEVPSVVERFEDYVEDFDVFNVGTNDLTQYTLATDRNNEQVTSYFKCYHPSLLSMLSRICRLARKHDKTVCICGEMAGELSLLPLLVGLGVRHLSVPSGRIGALKAAVRELDLPACEKLAEAALACRSTKDVEAVLANGAGARPTDISSPVNG
jgi:phosphoenolpyruvate-protein kinase (PTS system EI component)